MTANFVDAKFLPLYNEFSKQGMRLKTSDVTSKKPTKSNRERRVLLGLVDYYIQTGKPVGSNTLKEEGFEEISSATIRNYFANLEKQGYLVQQHSSGGRIPTNLAFRLYTQECETLHPATLNAAQEETIIQLRQSESREITLYLQGAAEKLSQMTKTAVFLSAPRFDNDLIIDLKLIGIDHQRCLAIIVTDFGVIQTEVLPIDKKLSAFTLKRIEEYFHWRLTGHDKPENLAKEEEQLAQQFYNEIMVRYIVNYSNFTNEEIFKTGFSNLLVYPEFHHTTTLANSLALFENSQRVRLLLKDCIKHKNLKCWIGEDLSPYSLSHPDCTAIAIPYKIGQQIVGALGLLGPIRMPYATNFQLLRQFSDSISETLTRNIFKFKISFRQPHPETADNEKMLSHSQMMLLENKPQ